MQSFLRRVRALLRRERLETDLAEELETHRLLLAERLKRDGMESAAAEAASRRAMGNMTLAREDARAAWIAPWLESVWQDLRYGVRHLRAHPAFTITTGATLLLATVLNTSFFTLFNATVLRTWPVPDAGRVVIVQSRSAEPGGADGVLMSDFEFMQKQARSFAALFAIRGGGSRVSTSPAAADEFTFYVQSAYVSANFFPGLRIPMAIGRGFVPDEDLPGPAGIGRHHRRRPVAAGVRRRSQRARSHHLREPAAGDHRRRHRARASTACGPSPMNSGCRWRRWRCTGGRAATAARRRLRAGSPTAFHARRREPSWPS